MFQIREINSPCVLYYSPGRDVAYCGVYNINEGLRMLEHVLNNQPFWLQDYMCRMGISKEAIEISANAFIASMEESLRSENVSLSAFADVPYSHKLLILALIAQPFIGETIQGRRDVLSEEVVKVYDPEEFYTRCLPIMRKFYLRPSIWDSLTAWLSRLLFGISRALRRVANVCRRPKQR